MKAATTLTAAQRRRRGGRLVVTALLSIASIAIAGCSSSSSGSNKGSSSTGSGKTQITIFNGATGTIAENFNPFSPTQLQPSLGVIYEPLYYYNLASKAAPTPELATAYKWNADGTVLTITTRTGVKWTDGQPFTAKDVAFTFNMIHNVPALNTSGLNGVASTTDDNTAVLTFKTKSFMQEPQILGNTPIVPEHLWSKMDPTKDINANPVGTGAYKLASFSSQSYSLTKNTNYWDPGKPKIDTVRYISLATADAASAALLAGQVDWMSAFLPNLNQLIGSNKKLTYVNTPALTASLFTCANAAMGCTGPQTDPAVRQAIYYGIDRTQLNKLAGGGFAAPASPTMLLPDRDASWIADPNNVTAPQTADVAKATSILTAAGYTKGSDGIFAKNGQRVSLTVQVVAGWSDFISAISVMTTELKAVGIELKSTQLAYNAWNSNETTGKFQLSMDSIGLGASDNPYFTYQPRYTSSNSAKVGQIAPTSGNYSRYANPKVDAAMVAAAATNDETVQKQQYAIAEAEVVRDLPYIPIYVNSMLTEFNTTNASGWPTNDNKFALPASWKSWDNGIVLKSLTPTK
jgi:peptide/nickel transport system substrate-binding protein